MCAHWIVGLSLQTGPNSPFPTAKFLLRSFAKGGEKGHGRKNKGTLLMCSKGTAPSPPSAESWRQYRSGMCPWNIRIGCYGGSLSSLVDGDKSVQLGELEDCRAGGSEPLLALALCPLECSRRVSAGHSARGAHSLLVLPRCGWKRSSSGRGRPGRGAARNVLRPRPRSLTPARAVPRSVLSDCSRDGGKGQCQRQNRCRAPV